MESDVGELNGIETIVDGNAVEDNACGTLNFNVPLEQREILPRFEDEMSPKVGMEFKSEDEVFEFYKTYAYHVGFPIKKRNTKKGDDGIVRYVAIAYSREGQRPNNSTASLKPLPTIRIGCKARLTAYSVASGIWRIGTVNLEHNHETSPSKSRLYRCNRHISDHVKRKLEVNDMAGIPLHKSFNSAVVEAGGYDKMTFIEKDCRNYIDKVRRLRLGEGDATAIQSYFSKMQALCPGFFFSVDLDDECRLRNVFWADNRCRQAYKEFGDVVTFDTTYLTNRYDMPFAPFVGVNHHGQTTLLGCGLLSNEDTDTFVWLFRTWLECMEYQAPAGIITDQDRAMQNAIEIVFPNTRHRWCLWHILKKLPEKFGYHNLKAPILSTVHDVVYESQCPIDFEHGWTSMVQTFELHDNDWLSGLYRERSRWVPCFLKTSFWAGMSTTQRSESINAFFDGYVHSKTSLKQFVEQYERAMRAKVEKEFEADFKSFSQMIPCISPYDMELQLQDVYTLSKFREFQNELTGKMFCEVFLIEEGILVSKYEVREEIRINGRAKRKKYEVVFDKDRHHAICSCHLFEFRGIVCRHIISVFIRSGIGSLPNGYIVRRWRRDVCRSYTRVKINYDGWIIPPGQHRYDSLCNALTKVAELIADDEVRYREAMEWANAQLRVSKLKPGNGSNMPSQQSVQLDNIGIAVEVDTAHHILDPKCSKTKGAPKKLRKKGPLEKQAKKMKVRTAKAPRRSGDPDLEQFTPATQGTQYPDLTALLYSQQFMGTHFQPWNATHAMNAASNFGMPTYAITDVNNEDDAAGTSRV